MTEPTKLTPEEQVAVSLYSGRAANCYWAIIGQETDLQAAGPAVAVPIIEAHIQKAEQAATVKEREGCAKEADKLGAAFQKAGKKTGWAACFFTAEAIRARKGKEGG